MSAKTKSGLASCSGCGEPQSDWLVGWLALDDGRHYCPSCRKNIYLLRIRWGLQLGDDTDEVDAADVLRALGADDQGDDDETGR
jgi:hypothetical protein